MTRCMTLRAGGPWPDDSTSASVDMRRTMTPRSNDAFGAFLLAHHEPGRPSAELIERDDSFIDSGSRPGLYFSECGSWSPAERALVDLASGVVLDIGCGAGRHSLYLQNTGLRVVAIDKSPGAIKVCKLRGLRSTRVLPIEELRRLGRGSFDTVLMLGNNFGLLGSPRRGKRILRDLHAITRDGADDSGGDEKSISHLRSGAPRLSSKERRPAQGAGSDPDESAVQRDCRPVVRLPARVTIRDERGHHRHRLDGGTSH